MLHTVFITPDFSVFAHVLCTTTCDSSHGSWPESMLGTDAGPKRKGRPVTIGSLSSHGSAEGSWSSPAKCTGKCLVYDVSKSPDDPFHLGVHCCLKDWEVYFAFTHLGTFDDFVQIKSNDEQIAKQIQQARQLVSKKGSATWPATEVREEDEVEVKVSTPMIGPSKAQIEKWTGCTPEELGMQLLTLTDVHHNAYKGVLMPDPITPIHLLRNIQRDNCEEVPGENAR